MTTTTSELAAAAPSATPAASASPRRKGGLDYANKLILAPMVRIGTLPMRLLALEYGADIVYTEELIDWKLLRSVRRENEVLGTVDYIDRSDGTVVLRTCQRERPSLVLQLGTCDPGRAVAVAELVAGDVAGIDVNMGCPKRFSLLGGMGAALLREPSKARAIVGALADWAASKDGPSISCKIRVLPSLEETVALVDELAASGVAAIAVHGRTPDERPQHPNRNDVLRHLVQHCARTHPDLVLIANGGSKEIESRKEVELFKRETGCSSVMLARAAEWNCSVFRREGPLPMHDVIKDYLKLACDYDNSPSNTKYCVQNVLRELQESPLGRRFLDTQTLEQICEVWDMGEYCRTKRAEHRSKGFGGRFEVVPERLATGNTTSNGHGCKRKLQPDDDDDVLLMRCAFLRNSYPDDASLPKSRLIKWARDNRKKPPAYETTNEDKLFRSVVLVDGRKYGSSFWEKSKRWAEQGAALVCLCALGVVDADDLRRSGILAA